MKYYCRVYKDFYLRAKRIKRPCHVRKFWMKGGGAARVVCTASNNGELFKVAPTFTVPHAALYARPSGRCGEWRTWSLEL